MNPVHISILFLGLSITQCYGNETSTCKHRETSLAFLNVALDMINKAKLHFPVCPTIINDTEFKPMDCEDLLRRGHKESGVYTVWLRNRVTGERPLNVFCDMETDGGGWTVIQRRGDYGRPFDFFFEDWERYKSGFGDIKEDFWLGNDNIFALTNQRLYSVRFDLWSVDGRKVHALYDTFWIDDEDHKYALHIKGYSGDAGDSLFPDHDNRSFTTKDQDNDANVKENCAVSYRGAWWYAGCLTSNLNGLYWNGDHDNQGEGVNWLTFKGLKESLHATEIKFRSKNFKFNHIKTII